LTGKPNEVDYKIIPIFMRFVANHMHVSVTIFGCHDLGKFHVVNPINKVHCNCIKLIFMLIYSRRLLVR
jgi:hypothetical protein